MRVYFIGFLIQLSAFVVFLFIGQKIAQAHNFDLSQNKGLKPVLGDLTALKSQNIPILYADEQVGVGFAYLTPEAEMKLQQGSHLLGKCGTFESLENQTDLRVQNVESYFTQLRQQNQKNDTYLKGPFQIQQRFFEQKIQDAIDQADVNELEKWVKWFSSFPSRYNKGKEANTHVFALQAKVQELVKGSKLPTKVDLIDHKSTPQKSLRVSIIGKSRPDEIIVMGGHFDSINGWGGSGALAPGADDNASGSANILEALRVLLTQAQPERTIEFFLYAGEESGLLGSAEIAEKYNEQKKSVIAVLQLDMTLFPGEGEFIIGNVTDFTSAWLRDYFEQVNKIYLNIKLVPDECGYACSDHASWYRNGFSTLLPFEATTSTMNGNIHTKNDVIDAKSNFKHSLVFAKLAVIFGMDLANSTIVPPVH